MSWLNYAYKSARISLHRHKVSPLKTKRIFDYKQFKINQSYYCVVIVPPPRDNFTILIDTSDRRICTLSFHPKWYTKSSAQISCTSARLTTIHLMLNRFWISFAAILQSIIIILIIILIPILFITHARTQHMVKSWARIYIENFHNIFPSYICILRIFTYLHYVYKV